MTTQCIFPVELIFLILYHTDPRDIVRCQTVSKWFRTIVNDALLWKALYANAPFPRPPGPFPTQSTGFLQRTLIKSAQLAQSWTTRPMRGLSSTQVHPKGDWYTPPKLICGRWLFSCESKRRFVLHDVNASAKAHARQVLWEVEKPVVSSWDMCWMTSVEGQCVVYVVLQFSNQYREGNSPSWQLLEFRLNDRSGELYYFSAVDLPESMSLNGRVDLRGGKSPFLFIHAASVCMVFDTRTRVFSGYKLPEFRIALDKTRREARGYVLRDRMAFTDTHLVSFRYLQDNLDYITVIQVFTVPPDGSPGENGNSTLHLTHEGLLDFEVRNVEVLRPSVDPVTGTTTVRLLDYAVRDSQVTRLDLMLPEPSAVDVLPMTVKMQHVDFPNDGAPATRRRAAFLYVDVSDNGQVRGCIRRPPQLSYRGTIIYERIMKFTIDTTHDPWVTACGKLSPAEGHYIGDVWESRIITFDGMRGKVCTAPLNNKTFAVIDVE